MDLVILAGGMGSRFGGLKQIVPIDEDGNFIVDYSIYDAIKAGFNRVVFIIKSEHLEHFKNTIGKRLEGVIPVEYALQDLDMVPKGVDIPEGRVKPWGTTHAIHCCKGVVDDKFAVINADDFYGFKSFKIVADFLRKSHSKDKFISAGFQVKNTLSDNGSVKRGIFVMENGKAKGLIESVIENRGGAIWATPLHQDNWKEIDENTLVSMQIFGFTSKLMDRIGKDIPAFFNQSEKDLAKAEYLLYEVVDAMINDGSANLLVKETPEKWYGITYREDFDGFVKAIKEMKEQGKYPKHLYKQAEKSNEIT